MFVPVLRRKERGVTLIELLIVILLMGVFAAMAIPFMGDMVSKHQIRSDVRGINNLFNYAKEEARRRNRPVFVAAAVIDNNGRLNHTAGGKWDAIERVGMVAYVDNDNNTIYNTNEDIRIFRLHNNTQLSSEISNATNQLNNNITNPVFIFMPNGTMRSKNQGAGLGAIGQQGKIAIKDTKKWKKDKPDKACRILRIDNMGRASACKNADTDACSCAVKTVAAQDGADDSTVDSQTQDNT